MRTILMSIDAEHNANIESGRKRAELRTLAIIEDLKEGELKIAEIARKHQVKWQSVHKIRRKLEEDGEL